MIQTPSCPEKQQLVDYLLGLTPSDRVSEYESHFESCDNCEETFRGINASDTFSGLVRQAAEIPQSVDDAETQFVQNLILQI